MKSYIKIPPKKIVYKYWEKSPLKLVLNKQAFDGDNNKCMACGAEASIDRAHIVSKHYGGSFNPSNIHCLCQICHKISEPLEGHDYWLWIALKSKLFSYGTDMTIEMDSGEDETLRPYAYEAEYPEKLQKYVSEYTELSLLEAWGNRSTISYLYLKGIMPNKYFDINYPCLLDIEEVMEVQEVTKYNKIHEYIPMLKIVEAGMRWHK
tara:strand:- start:537 stop:1157 length:621 start_codon:yes stop_codon:yes gene_type:complete